jgi:hypothetical protein
VEPTLRCKDVAAIGKAEECIFAGGDECGLSILFFWRRFLQTVRDTGEMIRFGACVKNGVAGFAVSGRSGVQVAVIRAVGSNAYQASK